MPYAPTPPDDFEQWETDKIRYLVERFFLARFIPASVSLEDLLQEAFIHWSRKRERYRKSAGYDAEHRRWREAVLARDKACQWEGCDQPATVADHIVPLSRGGARFDLENGQGLCRPHHSQKSASEDGGFGNETLPERQLSSYLTSYLTRRGKD